MRPSTRHNLNALIKDEIVKRFESVVKEEIERHNIAIEKSNRDLEYIKTLFEFHKKELESLKAANILAFKETQDIFQEEIKRIEDSFDSQRRIIRESVKKIDLMVGLLDDKVANFSTKEEQERDKKSLLVSLEEIKKDQERNLTHIDEEIWRLTEANKKERESIRQENEKTLQNFSEDMKDFKSLLGNNVVDAKGINRMIKVDQKTMFIMEKKIENLYTLFDRMKNNLSPVGG